MQTIIYSAKEQGFRYLAFCKSPANNLHPSSWLGTLETTFHYHLVFLLIQTPRIHYCAKMGFIHKLRTLLDDSDDGSPDRETRGGNNTRHFPESRTIKLVVSVTLALRSMACWSDSGKPREETCHQSGAIIEVTWHRGNQPEAGIGVLNCNGEAFIKQTHERLLLPCARKLCNTSHQPVRCPPPWGAGAGHVPATCTRVSSPDPPGASKGQGENTHNTQCKGAVSIHNNENELAWTSLNETAVSIIGAKWLKSTSLSDWELYPLPRCPHPSLQSPISVKT